MHVSMQTKNENLKLRGWEGNLKIKLKNAVCIEYHSLILSVSLSIEGIESSCVPGFTPYCRVTPPAGQAVAWMWKCFHTTVCLRTPCLAIATQCSCTFRQILMFEGSSSVMWRPSRCNHGSYAAKLLLNKFSSRFVPLRCNLCDWQSSNASNYLIWSRKLHADGPHYLASKATVQWPNDEQTSRIHRIQLWVVFC